MLSRLLQYSKDCQVDPPNFLNRQDACFKKLHNTCDTVFRSLRESSVGTVKRSAQTFQSDDKDKLWENNVFNTGTGLRDFRTQFSFMLARYAVCVEAGTKRIENIPV